MDQDYQKLYDEIMSGVEKLSLVELNELVSDEYYLSIKDLKLDQLVKKIKFIFLNILGHFNRKCYRQYNKLGECKL